MQFIIPKQQNNILTLIRYLGYHPLPSRDGEFNCVKSLSGLAYPRFHLYCERKRVKRFSSGARGPYIKENNQNWVFNLHLDQKKPSYAGAAAHSGEYDGELIEREIARIQNQLESGIAI